jgi:hypothetical protein
VGVRRQSKAYGSGRSVWVLGSMIGREEGTRDHHHHHHHHPTTTTTTKQPSTHPPLGRDDRRGPPAPAIAAAALVPRSPQVLLPLPFLCWGDVHVSATSSEQGQQGHTHARSFRHQTSSVTFTQQRAAAIASRQAIATTHRQLHHQQPPPLSPPAPAYALPGGAPPRGRASGRGEGPPALVGSLSVNKQGRGSRCGA